jgi:predicted DNA-binding protein with PD1-like motif
MVEHMKVALLHQHDGLRSFVVIFSAGDEAIGGLSSFAKEQGLAGSHFTAIGAFSRAIVAYFDWSSKQYRHVPIEEQVEVLSFTGDITIGDGKPNVHAHVVLGKADATAHGGHLIEGHVRPTLEVVITETPRHLHRRLDPASGLALIDPLAGGSSGS